jgi:hypothetical protein
VFATITENRETFNTLVMVDCCCVARSRPSDFVAKWGAAPQVEEHPSKLIRVHLPATTEHAKAGVHFVVKPPSANPAANFSVDLV